MSAPVRSAFDLASHGSDPDDGPRAQAVAAVLGDPSVRLALDDEGVAQYLLCHATSWANLIATRSRFGSDSLLVPGVYFGERLLSKPLTTSRDGSDPNATTRIIHIKENADIHREVADSTLTRIVGELVTIARQSSGAALDLSYYLAVRISLDLEDGRAQSLSAESNARNTMKLLPPGAYMADPEDDFGAVVKGVMESGAYSGYSYDEPLKQSRTQDAIGIRFVLHAVGYQALWHAEGVTLMGDLVDLLPVPDDHSSKKTLTHFHTCDDAVIRRRLNDQESFILMALADAMACRLVAAPPFMQIYPEPEGQIGLTISQAARRAAKDYGHVHRTTELVRYFRETVLSPAMRQDLQAEVLAANTLAKGVYLVRLLVFAIPTIFIATFISGLFPGGFLSWTPGFFVLLVVWWTRTRTRFWGVLPWRLAAFLALLMATLEGLAGWLLFGFEGLTVLDWVSIALAFVFFVLLVRYEWRPIVALTDLIDPNSELPVDIREQLDELPRLAYVPPAGKSPPS